MSTMAQQPGWSNPNLLLYLSTDDGLSLVGIRGVARVGHNGMQAVAEKLLDNCYRAVVGLGDIPEVCEALCMAVSRVPWERKRPLAILVNNLTILDDQVDSPEM